MSKYARQIEIDWEEIKAMPSITGKLSHDSKFFNSCTCETFNDGIVSSNAVTDEQLAELRISQGLPTGGFVRKYDGNNLEIGTYELRRVKVWYVTNGGNKRYTYNTAVIVQLENWTRPHIVWVARNLHDAENFQHKSFAGTVAVKLPYTTSDDKPLNYAKIIAYAKRKINKFHQNLPKIL